MPILDSPIKKTVVTTVAAVAIGIGGIVMNPTRPPRMTRPPDTPPQPDYSLAIDKPMAIEEFHGRYCQYFEMQLHAHRKSTGDDFTDGVTFKLTGDSGVVLDANGLMKGSANPAAGAKCGDEFILSVQPYDTLPPSAPTPALATSAASFTAASAPTITLPTPEMKAKAAASQKKIDGK